MTLEFLKDTALQWCKSYEKIQWIVTVPAIWSDAAKEMMRKASDKVCLIGTMCMIYRMAQNLNEIYMGSGNICQV